MRLAVGLLALSLIGVTVARTAQSSTLNELMTVIERGRDANQPVILDLPSVAKFEWEKVYFFPPYTPLNDVSKTLGFQWGDASEARIDERDDIVLIVFVHDSKVVEHLEYPRQHGDWSELGGIKGFTRADAVFEVRRESRGEPWLVLHPVPATERKARPNEGDAKRPPTGS